MKQQLQTIAFCAAMLGFGAAQASTINYSNSNGVNQNIAKFDQVYSGNDTDSALTVNFSSGSKIGFQFGLDAGIGATVLLDGNTVYSSSSDIWWAYDWNHPQVITEMFKGLSAGAHTLTLLWGEDCCNGYNSGRFTVNGGKTWATLDTANLDSLAPVPVPAAVWLFGSGLVGLMGMRRKPLGTEVAAA